MRFRHLKTGGFYTLQTLAVNEADLAAVAVYTSDKTGVAWVRPAAEFFDGRFQALPTAPVAPAEGDEVAALFDRLERVL